METTLKAGIRFTPNNYFNLYDFPIFRKVSPDKPQALKVLEEASEFVEASKIWMDDPDNIQRDQMLGEAADICQALSNFLHAAHVSPTEWDDARAECIKRNLDRGCY